MKIQVINLRIVSFDHKHIRNANVVITLPYRIEFIPYILFSKKNQRSFLLCSFNFLKVNNLITSLKNVWIWIKKKNLPCFRKISLTNEAWIIFFLGTCILQINPTTLFVVGGLSPGNKRNESYFYTLGSNTWTPGERLKWQIKECVSRICTSLTWLNLLMVKRFSARADFHYPSCLKNDTRFKSGQMHTWLKK